MHLNTVSQINQLPLKLPRVRPHYDWKTVVSEGAPVQEGLSQAVFARADDGKEYIAKGIGFGMNRTPYGPANELISALLGRELQIPMNEFSLLNLDERVLFGSE